MRYFEIRSNNVLHFISATKKEGRGEGGSIDQQMDCNVDKHMDLYVHLHR